jgi:hypothetical protein
MSNQDLPPPFIAEPPIYNSFFEENRLTMSNSWQNWLNSITRVMGFIIVQDFLIVGGERVEEVPTLQAISMSTTDRNSLDNARNGVIIYNTDTNAFNFRQGGTWVTFTPVPA